MVLIFGGAYNGKLEFALKKYEIKKEVVFFCRNEVLDYNKKIICGLHIFIQECIKKEIKPLNIIKDNMSLLKDKIIICDEINSGIVPMNKTDRIWREETGKILQYIGKNSSDVYRVFFGIEEKLK